MKTTIHNERRELLNKLRAKNYLSYRIVWTFDPGTGCWLPSRKTGYGVWYHLNKYYVSKGLSNYGAFDSLDTAMDKAELLILGFSCPV